MAHLTTKNLQKLCDILVTRPSWRVAMGALGAAEATAFNWRSKSVKAKEDNDTSSPFFFEWRGTYDYFHCHAGRARLENVMVHEATIREQSLNGVEEPIFGPDQKPIWKERPEYIGRSDDYIRKAEGLMDIEDVAWFRLAHDADGNPIQLTKRTQIPAPLRLRVLEQDKRYIHREEHDVQVSGEITVAKPLQRLPGEERPAMAEIKRLAAMTPEERRAELGAAGRPMHGGLLVPIARGVPDAPPRPSYARPAERPEPLDSGEGVGRGDVPPGGMKVA